MSCIPIQDFSLISLCDATKAGKLYSIVPDDGSGDFDVARNSTATYLGADGLIKTAAINEPRIEFNPDGSYKGLLVEPQRTNLFENSNSFDANTTPNTSTSPDGSTNASTFNGVTSNTASFKDGTSSGSNTIIYSVFAKSGTLNLLRLREAFYFGSITTFNLDLGTVLSGNGTIEDYGNGWYRCTHVVNYGAGQTQLVLGIDTQSQIGTIILYGSQAEAAPTASSYIPTVASTVTRVADVVTKNLTGFVGATEATIARFFNGDKIADVYSGGEKVSYVNGVAQAPVTEAIPTTLSPELGHTQVLATLPAAITEAKAIALTS